jgi:DNA (cytosine-5)-methyltransferase 1
MGSDYGLGLGLLVNYLSVCSGIEAATVAWHDMGWKPIGFSEIEKFPSQLLQHHYPNVTNYGDMTKFKEWNINDTVGLLVGGTPCQSFSVAGLRKGLEDPRGNLMLTYLGIADTFKPKWLLWENVPGVLSSNGGKDFACFLQGLVELGYGFAYRVLDAQHFGVPQRRRRVFVVGCLGDWRSAAKVLFESESLCRDITPSRSEKQKVTGTLTRGFGDRGYDLDQIAGGGYKIENVAKTLTTKTRLDYETETFALTKAYNITFCDANGTRKDRPNGGLYVNETDTSNTLTNAGVGTNVVQAFKETSDCLTAAYGTKWNGNASATNGSLFAKQNMRVRRLTPMECERLQGFPDNYTNTPTSSDTTRYKALGNSMAVPVMKWIGQKINELS